MVDEATGPAETPGRGQMTQPFEAGVVVRDMEVMERFYAEALGCVPVHRSRIPQAIAGPAGLGGQLLVVWLEVPSGGRIKLIQPQASAVSFPSAVPLAERCGLAYLTFHVDDVAPFVAVLPAAGASPLSSPVVVSARGSADQFLG
ncbi:VOC family protein [Lentzea nigeriaca]|uniref:VOC family protein n=1 Tax=Lentzea nigeriaca TaxID=1128665 RepID=UPI0019593048|nr:VOC family protein [Lentzea nigeriaca]MBM7863687.1 catechol 2,3-dioxygenase-like lactoylglutathione lyase family enzyme [Lentzea nigeriaca]